VTTYQRRCRHQRCRAVFVRQPRIGAEFDEQPHHRRIARSGGEEERRTANEIQRRRGVRRRQACRSDSLSEVGLFIQDDWHLGPINFAYVDPPPQHCK
jgi:hypothetical protein